MQKKIQPRALPAPGLYLSRFLFLPDLQRLVHQTFELRRYTVEFLLRLDVLQLKVVLCLLISVKIYVLRTVERLKRNLFAALKVKNAHDAAVKRYPVVKFQMDDLVFLIVVLSFVHFSTTFDP